MEILHPLGQPFTASSGGFILKQLTFTQTKTNFIHVSAILHFETYLLVLKLPFLAAIRSYAVYFCKESKSFKY